ncbi:MAG TPA: C80 family cysteine peptidase [Rhabdochlamydiaceae bacterium]|nr:C80 family cysteine peptidase [Rhabdochlamydiaceae bacterium]
MCSCRLEFCPIRGTVASSLRSPDQELLEALRDCAPTKKIETLREKVTYVSNGTLLELAILFKNPAETIRFLLDTGENPTFDHLILALEGQSAKEVIKLLINNHMDSSHLDSAIYIAIKHGNSYEVIKLLIDSGVHCHQCCVLEAKRLSASQAIIDLVTAANLQYEKKLEAQRKKREEEQKQAFQRKIIPKEASGSRPKYDNQHIIYIEPAMAQAKALERKAFEKGRLTYMFPFSENMIQKQMECVSHRSRVYIIAHGGPGLDFLTDESQSGKQITSENLANLFLMAHRLRKVPKNKQRVKISLVVCNGATEGDKGQKSFAENLSKSLYSKGILAEVVARKGLSSVDTVKRRKLVGDKHHAEGTKFSFITTRKGTISTPIKYNSP